METVNQQTRNRGQASLEMVDLVSSFIYFSPFTAARKTKFTATINCRDDAPLVPVAGRVSARVGPCTLPRSTSSPPIFRVREHLVKAGLSGAAVAGGNPGFCL